MGWLDCPHLQLISGVSVLLLILITLLLLIWRFKGQNNDDIPVKVISFRQDNSKYIIGENNLSKTLSDNYHIIINNNDQPYIRIILINHRTNQLNNLELLEHQHYYYNCPNNNSDQDNMENQDTYSLYIITPTISYDWEEYIFNFMGFNIYKSHIIWYNNRELNMDNTIIITIKSSLNMILKVSIDVSNIYFVRTNYFVDSITIQIPKSIPINDRFTNVGSINVYDNNNQALCLITTKLENDCEFKVELDNGVICINPCNEVLTPRYRSSLAYSFSKVHQLDDSSISSSPQPTVGSTETDIIDLMDTNSTDGYSNYYSNNLCQNSSNHYILCMHNPDISY